MITKEKITVMHFVYTLYGGVANVATGLINYQHSIGLKTVLVYCEYDQAIESQLEFKCEKICVRMSKLPGSSMMFGMHINKIYNEYKHNHIDEFVVVHVHNIQTVGAFTNLKGIPIICTLHGFNCVNKSWRKPFSDWLYRKALSNLISHGNKVTAVSKAITDAKECQKVKGNAQIHVIHNCADVNLLDKKIHKGFNVGQVGDLSYEKGWDTFIKGYKLLPEEYKKDIRLCSAGNEADFTAEWIDNEIKSGCLGDNVYYAGYVDNAKKDFISEMDVLVIASRNEGLGLVQIEAMGYGIPVLGRNVGGICEVLKNKFNGYVINDEMDLSRRIVELYEDKELYSKFCRNAINTYKAKFTREIIMYKYLTIYNELLNEHGVQKIVE